MRIWTIALLACFASSCSQVSLDGAEEERYFARTRNAENRLLDFSRRHKSATDKIDTFREHAETVEAAALDAAKELGQARATLGEQGRAIEETKAETQKVEASLAAAKKELEAARASLDAKKKELAAAKNEEAAAVAAKSDSEKAAAAARGALGDAKAKQSAEEARLEEQIIRLERLQKANGMLDKRITKLLEEIAKERKD